MLFAIVWKVAVLEVLTPWSVIALAMSDSPSLTDVFKEFTSDDKDVIFEFNELTVEFVELNFDC